MSKLAAPGDRLTPIEATTAETASMSKRGGLAAAAEEAAAAAAAAAAAEEGMCEDWPIDAGVALSTPDPLEGSDK